MRAEYNVTREQAKTFLLLKNGLISDYRFAGKQGALDFIRRAGCIQFDPIDICGKNSELVLQSRVRGFRKDMLYELLYEDRLLLDYFDKNLSIIPIEDFPNFVRSRERFAENTRSRGEVEKIKGVIIDFIKANGFARAGDFDFGKKSEWYWGSATLARVALETLYFRGELIIHHKKGTIKYYALASDFIPKNILEKEDENETELSYHKWQLKRRVASVGLLWDRASDAYLGIIGMKSAQRSRAFAELADEGELIGLNVAGVRDKLYLSADDEALLAETLSGAEYKDRTEFIAPLDNMIWDRRLTEALFGFDYRWEIYNRPEDRKFGYYTLPILQGKDFIGRVEAVKDKKNKILVIKNIWPEQGVKATKALKKGFGECVSRFAEFNDCRLFEGEWK
jgi:uncharacterized protein YcaQ